MSRDAPYRRFRRYGEPPTGTYTGDIVGCGWACRQCWSSFGRADEDRAVRLFPGEVSARLRKGMSEHGLSHCRISGGEAFIHADHVLGVLEDFLEHSAGTEIAIETNAQGLTPAVADQLERLSADRRDALFVACNPKAYDLEQFVWFTGMGSDAFDACWDNIAYLAAKTAVRMNVSVFNDLLDDDAVSELIEELESWRLGLSELGGLKSLRTYFPRRRDIDDWAGERRVRAAEREGLLGQPGFTEAELRDHRLG